MSFKREVIAFMEKEGETAFSAGRYFSNRDSFAYDHYMFRQWYRNKDALKDEVATKKRATGAGRKPVLGNLEDVLADEIVNLRLQTLKVSRSFVADRARQMAAENNIELHATGNLVTLILRRHGFSL